MSKRTPRPQSAPSLARLLKQFLNTFLKGVRSLPEHERGTLAHQLVQATDRNAPEPLAPFGKALSMAVLFGDTVGAALYREMMQARGRYVAALDRRNRKPNLDWLDEYKRLTAAGHKQAAIANRLGLSPAALRGRVQRARLAKLLD
jgi:hypothetical protein